MAKTKGRKKRTKRKSRSRYNVKSQAGPYPSEYRTTMRYSDDIAMSGAVAGLPTAWMFNAIDIRDPDRTGVGHQPLGFDQLEVAYEHFQVMGAKMTCTFLPTGTGYNGIGTLLINNGTATYLTPDAIREQGNSRSRIVNSFGSHPTQIVKYFNTKRFFGVKDVRDNHNLSGRSGGSPGENACLQVTMSPVDSGSIHGAYIVQVLIEYDVLWTERKPLPVS